MATTVPFLPDTAPFTPEQRAWLNGFLAGVFSRTPGEMPAVAPVATAAARPVLIAFGSQTGTCEGLAKKAAKEAKNRGFLPSVRDLADVPVPALTQTPAALLITSTYGDGEPPDNARSLHAALADPSAPRLDKLQYSICAVGDRNYAKFCQCGKDFDARLAALGARRVAPLVACELGHAATFGRWLDAALAALPTPGTSVLPETQNPKPETVADEADAEPEYHRENPFPAPLLAVRRLSAPDSAKEVNHVEFSLEGSGLSYSAGDALGVLPKNDPAQVSEILAALACDGEEPVATPLGERPFRTALLDHLDLGKPSPELLALLQVDPTALPHQVLDALSIAPNGKPVPAEFVATLLPLQPRLYSISSSPTAHPGQVHLTVGAVRYLLHSRARKGVASTFLADRAASAEKVGIYVHPNKGFRPPVSGDTPIIMVGPGTGIAPFRAFLGERRATGARGRNWLFFGDQKESTDFLYREELVAWRTDGLLTRLDLAWSREHSAKVYVQDRMREHAAELWSWLESGAHFYVCGDANRMARDVQAALLQVIEKAGSRTPEAAAEYLTALQNARRYQRDVY